MSLKDDESVYISQDLQINKDGSKSWIVMKFGGTSIGSSEKMLNISNIVKNSFEKNRIAVVLSAMSCENKTTGTTTKLLEIANCILKRSTSYEKIARSVLETYLSVMNEVFCNSDSQLLPCKAEIMSTARETDRYLKALFLLNEVTTKSRDYVVGYGERLSAILFKHILEKKGIKAEYISLHDLIPRDTSITEFNQDFCNLCSEKIKERINDLNQDTIPVLTGFFGHIPGGLIETVGRGYTDLAASIAAVGLLAKEIQIWKDVDGIFTTDPVLVSNARFIEHLTPEEAEELTVHGSEVIHPLAMALASKNSIPVRVRNSTKPSHLGTIIIPDTYWKPISTCDVANLVSNTGVPTALTLMSGVFLIYARPKAVPNSGLLLANIIIILEKHGFTTSITSLSKYSVSIVFKKTETPNSWESAMLEIEKIAEFHILDSMSVITLVGKGLRHAIGSSAKMFTSLSKRNVNIEMISQSAPEICISVVVVMRDSLKALKAIHDDCILGINDA